MPDNQLHISHDDGDADWFVLREVDAATAAPRTQHLLPSGGFALSQLQDALCATGAVRWDMDCLRLRRGTAVATLRDDVSAMFEYFIDPDTPSQELHDLRTAVDALLACPDLAAEIPLFAYAWLDLTVRDDLAEAARTSPDVWQRSCLEIHLQAIRDRRVEELVARYEQDTSRSRQRMAPSARQRPPRNRSEKLG